MEFHLVRNQEVEFRGPAAWLGNGSRLRKATPKHFEVNLTPVDENHKGVQRFHKAFLKSILENTSDESKLDWGYADQKISPNLSLSLSLPFQPKLLSWAHMKLFHRKEDKAEGCSILERLWNVFGSGNVSVNVTIKGSIRGVPNSNIYLEANGMQISPLAGGGSQTEYFCECRELEIPQVLATRWSNADVLLEGVLSVKVMLSHDSVSKLYLDTCGKNEVIERNKCLLNDTINCDVVIVPGNGAGVKCHKAFLSASSDVFRKMFECEMTEALTSCVKMTDMTAVGVRAFLAFIYHSDISAASQSCKVAFEMLQAAEKYGIPSLDSAMKELISAKPKEWVGVDTAVRILMFCKNLSEQDGMETLMKKAAEVLQWCSSKDEKMLQESTEYMQCHRNLEAFMELKALLIKFS